jgi:Glycosyl transferase family 2/O-Antigen ligase
MIAALQRPHLAGPFVLVTALVAGALAGAQPKLALAALAAGGVFVLAFRAPGISIALLLFITSVAPYGIQNQFGIGGGTSSPGLLLSDLLLISTLAWAVLTLANQRLTRPELRFSIVILVFLGIAALQFVHGLRSGHDVSRAGQELRVLFGFGVFLIALPLLAEKTRERRRLMIGLLVSAVAVGAWGLIQWFGHIQLGAAGDVGVRSGVRLTAAGSGQLQGAEYAYPVVIVVCFAILISRSVRSRAARAALMAALALSTASCFLTFERTFWLDALLGVALVLFLAPARQRIGAMVGVPLVALIAFGGITAIAPEQLATATQRLNSIGQYATDSSVRYRITESGYVLDRIRAHPIDGSGLAGTIFWGQPWAQVPPKSYTFSHNGYLWLSWKIGIPAAALLVLLIGWAIVQRGPPRRDPLDGALRRGAKGALAGLALATVTFPSFSALSITYVMGLLLAIAMSRAHGRSARANVRPRTEPRRRRAHQPPGPRRSVRATRRPLALVVVVTFLNEESYLPRFLRSIETQTRSPDRLVLVDDGSTDRSGEIASEFARAHPNAVLLRRPPRPRARDRLAEAGELKAFQWAVAQLDLDWDVVAKMDADLELTPATIGTIEGVFQSKPGLGMAGAQLVELGTDRSKIRLACPSDHVNGATKFYLRDCWNEIAPIAPILGWDTLDEFHARMLGWRTESFSIPGGDPLHLRRMGTHGPILQSFRRWGVCSYGYGAHPAQVLFYAARLARTRRPRVVGGLNYLVGWLLAAARGAPRAESHLRRAVRQEQIAKARQRAGRLGKRRLVTGSSGRS